MQRPLPAFLIGLSVGIVGVLLALFVVVQFNPIDSDEFRVIPKTAWFEVYPVNCIPDLCDISWLKPHYNSSILTNFGNLEGTDFETTTKLIKYHFALENKEIVDVKYYLITPSRCERGECFDQYGIEFLVSGDKAISTLREFGWRLSEKPNEIG